MRVCVQCVLIHLRTDYSMNCSSFCILLRLESDVPIVQACTQQSYEIRERMRSDLSFSLFAVYSSIG